MSGVIPVAIEKAGSGILCVIDFTEASKIALQVALDIASSAKSRLSVLYPYRLTKPMNVSDVAQWRKSIDLDATNSFTRMTSSLFKESGVAWDFKPEVGFIDDRVEAFTEKNNVGIIVMSSELSRTNNEALIDMLDRLTCPLLIVPEKRKQEL